MKRTLTIACVLCVSTIFADPTATVTSISQDPTTKMVTVTYSLSGGPAIVTMSATASGTDYPVMSAFGDVNRKLEDSQTHSIRWNARADLGNLEYAANAVTISLKAWSPSTPPDFMAVSLVVPGDVRYFASEAEIPGGIASACWKEEYLLMRRIPAKNVEWRMGSPSTEGYRNSDDQSSDAADMNTVYVTNANDYYLAVYEMTQWQHQLAAGSNPANFNKTSFSGKPHDAEHRRDWKWHPVETVSWTTADATASTLASFTGLALRLPTEQEWEFACRAESGDPIYGGYRASETAVYFQIMQDYYGTTGYPGYAATLPVGMLKPNKWNLYDMLGNVREWCGGWYDAGETLRPLRGSDCAWSAATARAASRRGWGAGSSNYRTGYRLCLTIE